MEKEKLKTIIIAALFSVLTIPTLATANDCTYWQQQINKVSRWSNSGGNAAQQQRWQKQQSYLQNQLAKCQGTTPGPISVTRGQPSNTTSYAPMNYFKSDNKDAELQQLIATCNRWIDIANNSATFENQSTRDTACRAANNKESLLKNPTQTSEIKIKRSIKECIKPNNVVDKDVKECMQGLKEPTWLAAKK
jgi:hypothetical protein